MLAEQQLILAKIQRIRVSLSIFLLNLAKIKLIFALFQLKLAKSRRICAKLNRSSKFLKKSLSVCVSCKCFLLCPHPLFCPVNHWLRQHDEQVSGPLNSLTAFCGAIIHLMKIEVRRINPCPSANLSLIVIETSLISDRLQHSSCNC